MVWRNNRMFHAPQKYIVLNYNHCILCSERSLLVKHHIFGFVDDDVHNSVRNIVLLCVRHHRHFAHCGHWGYSLSSRSPCSHYFSDYDKLNMCKVTFRAYKLWKLNPYNVDGFEPIGRLMLFNNPSFGRSRTWEFYRDGKAKIVTDDMMIDFQRSKK